MKRWPVGYGEGPARVGVLFKDESGSGLGSKLEYAILDWVEPARRRGANIEAEILLPASRRAHIRL